MHRPDAPTAGTPGRWMPSSARSSNGFAPRVWREPRSRRSCRTSIGSACRQNRAAGWTRRPYASASLPEVVGTKGRARQEGLPRPDVRGSRRRRDGCRVALALPVPARPAAGRDQRLPGSLLEAQRHRRMEHRARRARRRLPGLAALAPGPRGQPPREGLPVPERRRRGSRRDAVRRPKPARRPLRPPLAAEVPRRKLPAGRRAGTDRRPAGPHRLQRASGTLLFVDTCGFHRGGRATSARRVLATSIHTTPASPWPRRFRASGDMENAARTAAQRWAVTIP